MDFVAREIAGLRMSVGELATRDYVRSELRAELRAILAELETTGQLELDDPGEKAPLPSLRTSVQRRRDHHPS